MRDLDLEHLASHARVGEPGRHADLVVAGQILGVVRRHAQQLAYVGIGERNHRRRLRRRLHRVTRGHRRLGIALHAPARELARHPPDASLELAHSRFPRVGPHDAGRDFRRNQHRRRVDAVPLQLTREEELPRDRVLLLVEIAGEPDDLHPVAQRLGDRRQRVGRGDEQHLRQIVVDLEVVIVEGAVLLGVEHFEQRRRRDRRGSPAPACRPRRAGSPD